MELEENYTIIGLKPHILDDEVQRGSEACPIQSYFGAELVPSSGCPGPLTLGCKLDKRLKLTF